jgi:hypothetical protein
MDNMNKQVSYVQHILYRMVPIFLIIFILISCETVTSTPPQPTETAIIENIVPKTQPVLPAIYQSRYLNPLDTPRTYLEETCQYLRRKWDPLTAQPGTVVMIIMFHAIQRGPVDTVDGLSVFNFDKIMLKLREQDFQTINTKQFLAFMERNVKIPSRSVLIIQDGSYDAENFDNNFREYNENWGWSIVNGWVSELDMPVSMWEENIALEREEWVDHQAQGVVPGTILSDDTSKVVITRELEGSMTAFANRFGKTPYAFIWPGGGFGLRPVQAARQLGYQLGFTSNSRGPVMYNWVPLADQVDPQRPSYIPEGLINDPLMTLPRYAPDQVLDSIDTVRNIGNEAGAYARANKAVEVEYYEAVCRAEFGPMPSP